jgi:lipoprotein NlpI
MSGRGILVYALLGLAMLAVAAGPVWAAEAAKPAKVPVNAKATGLVDDGMAKYQAGNLDGAMADFTKAYEEQKTIAQAYYGRAGVQFVMGKFTDASETLQKLLAVTQDDKYAWMLAYVANARGGNADRGALSSMQALTDEGSWFGQTLALFMDQMSPEDYLRSVKEASKGPGKTITDAETVRTHFMVAEALLIKNDKDAAATHFKMAVDTKGDFQWEREMAKSELDRLEKKGAMETKPAAAKPIVEKSR